MYGYYEKSGTEANWQRFLIDITFYLYGCSEFKYYILTYLNYAEQHHPDIYEQLIAHKPFIYTFFKVDRLINELFAYYLEGREHVFALLESYGWQVWVDDRNLYIKKNGRTQNWPHLIDAREEIYQWIEEGDFKRQLNAMNASIAGWDKDIFVADLRAMTLRLPEKMGDIREAWEPFENLHAVANDPVQDVPYSFIDFTRAGVALNTDGSMWIHMEMSDIPEQLACGQPDVRPSVFEYTWELIFSVLGDTTRYYTINLYEYYGREPYITDIISDCAKGVYEDAGLIEDIEIEGRQVENTLILHINPNKHFQFQGKTRVFIFKPLTPQAKGKYAITCRTIE